MENSSTRRLRFRTYIEKFPEAVLLAVLTAATTILMIILLTFVTGNKASEDRLATRCYAAQTHAMVREILIDRGLSPLLDRYPRINTTGLNCKTYFVAPIDRPLP